MRQPIIPLLLSLLVSACDSQGSKAPDLGAERQDATIPATGGAIPNSIDGAAPGPELVVSGPLALSDALAQINQRIQDSGLPVRQLSIDDIHTWFDESKSFMWSKADRKLLQQHVDLGDLIADWTLTLEQIVVLPGAPWRITLCGPPTATSAGFITPCGTVAEGLDLSLWVSAARSVCQAPTHNLCDEPFLGPFASADPVALSPSVEVRVESIQVSGEPKVPDLVERDALAVWFNLSAQSIPALVGYFGVGYDRTALEDRLRSLLGTADSKWVRVQEFLFGWVRDRANTFPQVNDNDVCHGPARQFYSDVLYNGDYDSSTEAVAVLLDDHYCQVADDAPARFGDYLYNPGAHSARYILMDPATSRDIVFSVQSGGFSPYRFYWADEDMSGKPFEHQPMSDYREALVDVWRRCR